MILWKKSPDPLSRQKRTFRFTGTFDDDIEQERMPAERLGETKLDVGKSFGETLASFRQIPAYVDPLGQEVRQQDHLFGALLHTAGAALLNVRLDQL
jgi:hypothetical protein